MGCQALLAALVALAPAASLATAPLTITLDGGAAAHVYEGHGALSAGASSRLLWDYPEPQRTEVLDYLFKPNFGGAFHVLKVEIGGDVASTDGTEPSHEHSRGDLSCTRGYELWLIQQAKQRNPAIITYGLSWGTPAWINNNTGFYGPDQISYQIDWLKCMKQQTGFAIDLIGLHNEAAQPNVDYVVQLRAAMNAVGFGATGIIVMDGGYNDAEITAARANATYRDSIRGAGLHYPCNAPHPDVRDLGWTFWSSEDYSRDPEWKNGGTYWGKALSQNYVLNNMTSTISWSLIWSAYTNLVCNGAGLMRAHQPWTGNYEVSAPIWLTAHWTQFTQPGWRFLSVPGGGSGFLTAPGAKAPGGTFVTLVPPNSLNGMTLILETLDNDACVPRNYTNFNLSFTTRGGLPGPGTVLQVFKTTSSAMFVRQPDIVIDGSSSFTVVIDADSMMTLSTVSGAVHGGFPSSPIPASAPWPLPYSETFDSSYAYDDMAFGFSDQGGSWAVRNGSLQQVAEANPGVNGWAPNPDPLSQIGDETWDDYAVGVSVTFSSDAPGRSSRMLSSANAESAASTRAGGAEAVAGTPSSSSRQQRSSQERLRQWRIGHGGPAPSSVTSSTIAYTLREGDAPIYLVPCDAADPAQAWSYGTTSPGYLSNAAGKFAVPQCLNVAGCDPTNIITYACVNDPNGSSCGAPPGQYPNLVWNLDSATGALTSVMNKNALTLHPNNKTLFLAPFVPGTATQMWTYNASTYQLSVMKLCLSTPPIKTYAQVCGRISSYNGFDATTTPGYCFSVNKNGLWILAANSVPLVSGNAPQMPFDSTISHRLEISMAGPVIEAYFDESRVASVTDGSYSVGNAAVGSGWHVAAFNNFSVTVPF